MIIHVARRVCANYDRQEAFPFKKPITNYSISWGEIKPCDLHDSDKNIIDPYAQETVLPNRLRVGQIGISRGNPIIQIGLEQVVISDLRAKRSDYDSHISYAYERDREVGSRLWDLTVERAKKLTDDLNELYDNTFIFLNLAYAKGFLPKETLELSKKMVPTRNLNSDNISIQCELESSRMGRDRWY